MLKTQPSRNSHRQAVSNVYSLLSRLWLAEIDEPLLRELSKPRLRDAFAKIGGVIPDRKQLDELAIEYCRLFIGPRDHLPPIQSVWQRAQLQSDITDSVQAFADLFGYSMPIQHDGILDHLGIELDMMSAVLANGVASDEESAAVAEFFARHLSWPSKLLDAANDQTQSTFYKSLMQITREFLQAESAVWLNQETHRSK